MNEPSCNSDYCEIEKKSSKKSYQELAMRTNDGKASYRLGIAFRKSFDMKIDVPQLIEGLLGLLGESGEFGDLIKKWIFYERGELDEEHAKKELGDVCWYIALICDAMNWSLDDIMQKNIEKLRERYPEGFSVEQANHRDADDV